MITADIIAKVARLARLRLTPEETQHYAAELSGIFQWIEQLNEVDTQHVPALTSVADLHLPWRKDAVTDGNQQAAVLKNAPKADHGCFLVPKVIE